MKKEVFNRMKKFLIMILIFSTFFNTSFGVIFALTTLAEERVADPSTVDNYKNFLSSRYNGKIWTDKSVYSYDDTRGNVTLDNGLSYVNAGNGFNFNFNDDFLTVFSALGSSEAINETPPIDLVIILDVSGTMGVEQYNDEGTDWDDTRIQITINNINRAIDYLMKKNPANRVGLAIYGHLGKVVMPLDHYTSTNGTSNYITVEDYYEYKPAIMSKQFDLVFNVLDSNGKPLQNDRCRNELGYNSCSVGNYTNMQAGILAGMGMLANTNETTYVVPTINKTVSRIPLVFVLTDGGSNTISDGSWYAGNPDASIELSQSNELDGNYSGSVVILHTLLTAAYLKTKIQHNYYMYDKEVGVYTFGIDISTIRDKGQWEVPRLDATLDPKKYFNSNRVDDADIQYSQGKSIIPEAYNAYLAWKDNTVHTLVGHYFPNGNNYLYDPDFFPGDGSLNPVTKAEMIKNINYVTESYVVSVTEMESIFDKLIQYEVGNAFNPISGQNSKGETNILTYTDPIGEYMEIKSFKKLILFGNAYDITKASSGNTATRTYYNVLSNGGDKTITNEAYNVTTQFKLSDIKIWVDKINNQETLHVSIPSTAIPLKADQIIIDASGDVESYSSNQNTVASTPLRIVYTVGAINSIFKTDGYIDPDRVSEEYAENNTITESSQQYIYFYSNYFNKKGNGYGDAEISFSPSSKNKYYIYDNNFILYTQGGEGILSESGGTINLSGEVTNLSNIDKNATYSIPIYYYESTGIGSKGKLIKYAVAKKGSDFYGANGEVYLTYFNKSTSTTTTSPGNNIVVATKVGGYQYSNTNTQLLFKSSNKTSTSGYTDAMYMVSVSNGNSVVDKLGNNGRLYMFFKTLFHKAPLTGGLGIKNSIIIGLVLILVSLLVVLNSIKKYKKDT